MIKASSSSDKDLTPFKNQITDFKKYELNEKFNLAYNNINSLLAMQKCSEFKKNIFLDFELLNSMTVESPYNLKSVSSQSKFIVPVKSITDTEMQSLLSIMEEDIFEAGEIPESEIYVSELAEKYGWVETLSLLMNIYHDYYSNSHIQSGLMHILSHFHYDSVKPNAVIMALGLLQHENIYVRDFAVKAFENWNSRKALPILKALNCEAPWLQDYVNYVVDLLESGGVD